MSLLPPSPAADRAEVFAGEFSSDERKLLLQLAHDAIAATLERRTISLDPPTPHFAEPRGAFTSLYLHGQLRGCVGYVFATSPVYRAVAETAQAAAFEDTRFRPVTQEEAPELTIELSILSPLQPIAPEAIEIGRHGLLVSLDGHRGLLLPQVPVEHAWDRVTFLEQTSARPASRSMPGSSVRRSKPSPQKCSGKSSERPDPQAGRGGNYEETERRFKLTTRA